MPTDRKIQQVKKHLKDWVPQMINNKKGLSLRDIAKKTGLTYSTVFRIKAGGYDKPGKPNPIKQKGFDVDKGKNWLI